MKLFNAEDIKDARVCGIHLLSQLNLQAISLSRNIVQVFIFKLEISLHVLLGSVLQSLAIFVFCLMGLVH